MNNKKDNIIIRNKLINNITLNGEKKTSEKILLNSLKELQKVSHKKSKELIQLAVINATPLFKIHESTNKKQRKKNRRIRKIPSFISKLNIRTSLAIKFILKSANNKNSSSFYSQLKQDLLLTAQAKNDSIEFKNSLQKETLLNKRFLKYYKWN